MDELTLMTYIVGIPQFLSDSVIPFILGIAFLFFVVNMVRYFVIGGANDADHEKAHHQLLYSLAAFVFVIIFWGVVAVVASSVSGLTGQNPTCPDYIFQEGNCRTYFRQNNAPAGPETGDGRNY